MVLHGIAHICHRHVCKNFLSGVNFSRLSEKKCIYLTFSETFLVFLVPLVVILGVKFGFRKSCLCKRNDKYEVWYCMVLHYLAPSCTILHHPAPSCTILNHLAPSCTILHHVE